jgi:hypothetical protein
MPLSHPTQIQMQNERLWYHEQQLAHQNGMTSLVCPFTKCRGCRQWVSMAIVHKHLIQHKRHPFYWVWKGLGDQDSSNEEWVAGAM